MFFPSPKMNRRLIYIPDIKSWEAKLPLLYAASALEIPGARTLLQNLTSLSLPWGIVTSGTTPLVTGWFRALSLPAPPFLVVAEDVEDGKPHPACYLLGRSKLGLRAERGENGKVLVLEDSPAGIKAGKEAGCSVLAVVTSHTAEQVAEAGADWVVKDLSSVKVRAGEGGRVEVEILDALVVR